jgi:uncharacterized protein (DUF927 family)
MKRITRATSLALVFAAAAIAAQPGTGQIAPQAASNIQPVSWDAWLLAKVKAEENDAAGNLVTALQYYLEYTRQAQELNSPARVAWGKNNAAYMIIKMHRQDPTVDLTPAEKLLEEGLAVAGATEDCRRVITMNLEHVKLCLGRTD